MKFADLFRGRPLPQGHLFAVDPGETTGIAWFRDGGIMESAQLNTLQDGSANLILRWILDRVGDEPFRVVCEDYRVYAWRAKQHAWSSLHTPRLIGGLETLLGLEAVSVVKQPAHVAKQFCTDDKLKEWDYYVKGKHARDAVRHGCYYLLFHKREATACPTQ